MRADDDFYAPARVLHLDIEPGRRILVISDIHGNLEYLKGVLQKAGFGGNDILIIDGDYLEKGPDSLGVIRYLMELSKQGNTYVLNGNCDGWSRIFVEGNQRRNEYIISYMHGFRYGIVYEVLKSMGIDPDTVEDICPLKQSIYNACPELWDFISTRPHAIETEHYVFAHAGRSPEKPLSEHLANEVYRIDAFMNRGQSFDKWVICGHWPVVLYRESIVNANPVIDRERKIISIDGGCVLKDDGQLNCLIIPFEGSEEFRHVYYDCFPAARVLTPQEPCECSYYIRWGDSEVEVLDRGEEFSHCRHVRTGYEMDILTKYLFTDNPVTKVNDCSDYRLRLNPGDEVSVVESCSSGYYVKHNGISGWYFGELDFTGQKI